MSATTMSISKCVTDVPIIIGSDTSRSLNKEDKDKIEHHLNDSPFLKEGVSKFCREDYMNLSKPVVLPLNQENFVLVSREDYDNYAPLIYEYEQNMINEDEEEDMIPSIYETQMKANWQYPDPPKLLRSYQRRIHSIYYKFDGKFLRAKYNSTICASVPCSWIPVRLDDGTIIWYNELV